MICICHRLFFFFHTLDNPSAVFPKLMFLLYFSIQVVLKHMNGDWEEQIYHMKDGQPLDYYNIGQFFCIFIAHSLCAIIVELYKDGFGWATFTMLLHHVITVASYVGCMLTGRFAYLCCLSSLCEITNFPLSLLYISKFYNSFCLLKKDAKVLTISFISVLFYVFYVFFVLNS